MMYKIILISQFKSTEHKSNIPQMHWFIKLSFCGINGRNFENNVHLCMKLPYRCCSIFKL